MQDHLQKIALVRSLAEHKSTLGIPEACHFDCKTAGNSKVWIALTFRLRLATSVSCSFFICSSTLAFTGPRETCDREIQHRDVIKTGRVSSWYRL